MVETAHSIHGSQDSAFKKKSTNLSESESKRENTTLNLSNDIVNNETNYESQISDENDLLPSLPPANLRFDNPLGSPVRKGHSRQRSFKFDDATNEVSQIPLPVLPVPSVAVEPSVTEVVDDSDHSDRETEYFNNRSNNIPLSPRLQVLASPEFKPKNRKTKTQHISSVLPILPKTKETSLIEENNTSPNKNKKSFGRDHLGFHSPDKLDKLHKSRQVNDILDKYETPKRLHPPSSSPTETSIRHNPVFIDLPPSPNDLINTSSTSASGDFETVQIVSNSPLDDGEEGEFSIRSNIQRLHLHSTDHTIQEDHDEPPHSNKLINNLAKFAPLSPISSLPSLPKPTNVYMSPIHERVSPRNPLSPISALPILPQPTVTTTTTTEIYTFNKNTKKVAFGPTPFTNTQSNTVVKSQNSPKTDDNDDKTNKKSTKPHKLSKNMGLIISIGSLLSKIPQIVEVFAHRSVNGLSLPMFVMEYFTQVIATYYHYKKKLPLDTYGENISLGIGNIGVLLAFIMFGRNKQQLTALLSLMTPFLVLPVVDNEYVLSLLQLIRIPIYCLSRIPQITQLYNEKDPQHLNPTSFAVNFCGSVARIFTSAKQNQRDPLILGGFWASIFLNATVLGMIGYYKR